MSVLRAICLVISLVASTQAGLVSLDFSNNTTPTNANHSELGDFIAGAYSDFEEVAPGIDARVTGFVIGNGHTYDGLFPNHGSGNLGFLYTGNNNAGDFGGIEVTIDFFESDGAVNDNTQLTTASTLDTFELLFHDIDGEPGQSEFLQAFVADGLVSYRVSNIDPVQVAFNSTTYQFLGNGVNLDETDASGATILRYRGTDSVTFRLFAQTFSNAPNGVFQAIDGDMDTIPSSEFGAAVSTPEPSSLLLSAFLGLGGLCVRRRRRQSRVG